MDLSVLPTVGGASVWKKGSRAGTLRRTEHGVAFEYAEDYGGLDVATTFRRSNPQPPRGGGALPPFFSGLLPEGRRLTAIRRAIKTSADDELSLLMAIGEDTIGDVQVRPIGFDSTPTLVPKRIAVDRVVLRELFEEAVGPAPERVGLPGVQDKISGRMIAWPAELPNGPAMIKLSPPEFPHLVENEAFFLRAARWAGLAVPGFEVVTDAAGETGLCVRRFDRVVDDGGLALLAQEDGCQVLGRYPADKYAVELAELIQGLAGVTSAPAVASFRLFQQVVFGYLIGNGDQHGKNLAVVESEGGLGVSPLYDTPSSYPYGDTTLALPIAGERGLADVPRRRWLDVASRIDLPQSAAERAIDRLLGVAPRWIAGCEELPFDDRGIHKLQRFLSHRLQLLSP